MDLLKQYILRAVKVVLVIGGLVAARLTRRRSFELPRALAINALMGCCYAVPFLRLVWDKAAVAFLVIFFITSLFAVGRCIEHRHYLSTLVPRESIEKVQS